MRELLNIRGRIRSSQGEELRLKPDAEVGKARELESVSSIQTLHKGHNGQGAKME